MSRQNRVYENMQVQSQGCLCFDKSSLKTHNNLHASNTETSNQLAWVSRHHQTGLKNKRLKLSKYLLAYDQQKRAANSKDLKQSSNLKSDIISKQHITAQKYPTLSVQTLRTGQSYNNEIDVSGSKKYKGKHFMEGDLLWNKSKNTQPCQKINSFMDENINNTIANEINLLLDFRNTKIQSTSTTTLFETKKYNEDFIDDHSTRKVQQISKQHTMAHKEKAGGSQARQKISLSFIDFSRVREVETVNSDSFNISFIDEDVNCGTEVNLTPRLSLEMEIKRLLSN